MSSFLEIKIREETLVLLLAAPGGGRDAQLQSLLRNSRITLNL